MKKTVLKKCEEKLLTMQEEILASLKERTDESLSVESDVQDETDIAQEATAKSVSLALAEKDKVRLEQIKQALNRIRAGTYGICVDTEEEIEERRLLANPLALRSIAAQESFEKEAKQRATATRGGGFGGAEVGGGDDE